MKNKIKLVSVFLLGAIIFGTIGVYATARYMSKDISYTKNDGSVISVEEAINELYSKKLGNKLCKRAMELHNDGTHTFGNLGTKGTLTSGDAFDCDVNGDGYYSPITERFYYLSEYYNTQTKQFENDTAALIYYSNTVNDVPNNVAASLVAYNSSGEGWNGPITAVSKLPKASQWKNVKLKNTKRAILTESSTNTIAGNITLTDSFNYVGYAARLLTIQELNATCHKTATVNARGDLDNCNYLMENTAYSASAYVYGYWLETLYSGGSVYNMYSGYRSISANRANYTSSYGVRPVIDVPLSDIEY